LGAENSQSHEAARKRVGSQPFVVRCVNLLSIILLSVSFNGIKKTREKPLKHKYNYTDTFCHPQQKVPPNSGRRFKFSKFFYLKIGRNLYLYKITPRSLRSLRLLRVTGSISPPIFTEALCMSVGCAVTIGPSSSFTGATV
jgi:hypothetical protein